MNEKKKKELEKQGYRIVGDHSAIKVCYWTKECIRGKDVCYKNTFYGINTHQCVQMSPVIQTCTHRCTWCWRDINHTSKEWEGSINKPDFIIDGCIKAHKQALIGFKGNNMANVEKYKEATEPKHFAISLTGEPTFYPYLPEFINKLKEKNLTSFLVTNGTNPIMLNKIINNPPTQLYLTLPAPNKEVYEKVCNPLIKNGWEKIMKSIELLKAFPRSVIRLTMVKNGNMLNPEEYVLIAKNKSDFIELKGYVYVGFSQERLTPKNQPTHDEIKEFAKKMAKLLNYEIVSEKINSKVVLLKNPNSKRGLNYWE